MSIYEDGWESLERPEKIEFLLSSVEILGWLVASSQAFGSPSNSKKKKQESGEQPTAEASKKKRKRKTKNSVVV